MSQKSNIRRGPVRDQSTWLEYIRHMITIISTDESIFSTLTEAFIDPPEPRDKGDADAFLSVMKGWI